MNKEELKISIKNESRLRIAPDSELSTGKVIINNIEITSIEDWGKVVDSLIELQQENQKYKEVIDKAINNSQYWIDYYTKLNSDERIALRLQENIDILKEVE